jgi:hypothetical protein
MESALSFTIGYHAFHPDRSINYQLNRFSDGTPASVAELSGAAQRITDYADYTRELRTLLRRGLRGRANPRRRSVPALGGVLYAAR